MGLLKKKEDRKPFVPRGSAAAGPSASMLRPVPVAKTAPCDARCPSGNDVRGWLTTIAQREKLGLTFEAACDAAWRLAVEGHPFPAVMGRLCPHPCEGECSRKAKDGSVAINAVERFLGDYAIERRLPLPRATDEQPPPGGRVAIIGAGPAGLACAYHLARRGHGVTVFDAFDEPGGFLRYGVPPERLPRHVLNAEIGRIVDLGVEIRSRVRIGEQQPIDDLVSEHAAVFVSVGAGNGHDDARAGLGGRLVVVGRDDAGLGAARGALRAGLASASASRLPGAVRQGFATFAIGEGRRAAESIDGTLRGRGPLTARTPTIGRERIQIDYYDARERAARRVLSADERLAPPEEVDQGIEQAAAIAEASRCFSCGLCFGCERCWMYCQNGCITKAAEPRQGRYYDIDTRICDGCRKCADACPCGFLDMV